MNIKIYNLYNNEPLPQSDFKGDHGSSYLLQANHTNIMFDVGTKSEVLLYNMGLFKLHPEIVSQLIFSHGHYDHTNALPKFLDLRPSESVLPIYAHPSVLEKKYIKLGPIRKKSGFPSLTPDQQKKIQFNFSKDPQEIFPFLITTGEITDRPYKQGIEKRSYHQVKDKEEVDPVWDDNSLVLKTKEGIILLLGCAHAGILNICHHIAQYFNMPIRGIIGGSHMVRYSVQEVIETGETLKSTFNYPKLWLNHCTDQLPFKFLKTTPALNILSESYGKDKVHKFYAGAHLSFEI